MPAKAGQGPAYNSQGASTFCDWHAAWRTNCAQVSAHPIKLRADSLRSGSRPRPRVLSSREIAQTVKVLDWRRKSLFHSSGITKVLR